MSKALIFCLKDDTKAIFYYLPIMKYYTFDELKEFATEKIKIDKPHQKLNIKNIGIWLKKSGYIKVRKQIENERKLYYYH